MAVAINTVLTTEDRTGHISLLPGDSCVIAVGATDESFTCTYRVVASFDGGTKWYSLFATGPVSEGIAGFKDARTFEYTSKVACRVAVEVTKINNGQLSVQLVNDE